MNEFGLENKEILLIKKTLADYKEIVNAKIFGSRAKGEYKKYSDIDLAVYGEIDYQTVCRLKDELEELDLIYRFDVVHYEKLSEKMIDHIDRVGKVIYTRNNYNGGKENEQNI
jgi:predicted nucleotidyltransferase